MTTPSSDVRTAGSFVPSPRWLGQYHAEPRPSIEMTPGQLAGLERLRKAIDDGQLRLEHVARCACGAEESVAVSAIERWGLPLGAHACLACGLLYTSPRIAADSLPRYYDEYYDAVQLAAPPSAATVMFRPGQGRKIYHLVRGHGPRERICALEIGCAAGSVLKEFFTAAAEDHVPCEARGFEYGSKLVAAFRAEGTNVRVEQGGIEEAIRAQLRPNVIILSHVFEHFNDPLQLTADLRRLCDDQTLLYIEVPGVLDLWRRPEYGGDWLRYMTCSHPYHYNLVSLTHVMNAGGFALQWGNEVVESLFRLGKQETPVSGNARRVLAYLEMLEYAGPCFDQLNTELAQLKAEVARLRAEIARNERSYGARPKSLLKSTWRRLRARQSS